jgi:GNAT superfamily N-acetyltransferase
MANAASRVAKAVVSVYVAADARGNGIGDALLSALIISDAASLSASNVQISVLCNLIFFVTTQPLRLRSRRE